MGKPLKNPPVYFTVAQVRFNMLLKLADYLPSIQEGLRKAGFPAFTHHTTMALQFSIQEGKPVPQPVSQDQYLFANSEQTHCFVLGQDTLTFQSTNYGTFEVFSKAFLKGLELVHEVVTLDFTDRVGLRYLDQVSPKAGESLESYIVPEAQGIGARLGGEPMHSLSETLIAFGRVKLLARSVVQDKGLAFPPDLFPQEMQVQTRFAQVTGRHAILDTDGFVEGRELFSLTEVQTRLQEIHDVIGSAFKSTVTDHALATWDE